MKRRLTFLTLFITLCFLGFAQEKYFQFNSYLGNTMTITSQITIDGEIQGEYIEVGAFIGDVCHGAARITNNNTANSYVAFLRVYGANEDTGKDVTFRLYDHNNKQELDLVSNSTVEFHDDDIIGDVYDPFIVAYNSVAETNGIKYGSLPSAVAAAQDGGVVTLINTSEGRGVKINKNVTIDFDGKTYTFNEGVGSQETTQSNGFQILENNTVTLMNGTLNVAEEAKDKFYILVQNYANLTVEDMVLDGTNLDKWSTVENNWDSYTLSNNSGTVNITGTTKIIVNNEGVNSYAFDVCKFQDYPAPVVTLGDNVTIVGKVEITGGQFYTNKEDVVADVKKTIAGVDAETGSKIGWNTISTPIAYADIPEATAGTHDLYRYDEVEQQWEYYTGSNASNPYATLELGRGYLYANTEDITLTLNGEINVNDVIFPLSYTEGNIVAGFNMVGNPFTYDITQDNFVTTNAELADGFYLISNTGAWVPQTAGTKIAPMQSVLVKTDMADNLTILKNQNNRSQRAEEESYIAINVSNANYSDIAYVSFNEGYGLNKINHHNTEIPMVYVSVEGKDYAIAKMSQDVTEIPVSFVATTMGEYTIAVETEGCQYSGMTLVDSQTGVETNMLLEDYTFVATSNDNVNRFVLRLVNGQQSTVNDHFAYINNGALIINNIEGDGVIRVLDVLGRPVAEYKAKESVNISTSAFGSGVYMIQMSDNNGVKVQKVVIE